MNKTYKNETKRIKGMENKSRIGGRLNKGNKSKKRQ